MNDIFKKAEEARKRSNARVKARREAKKREALKKAEAARKRSNARVKARRSSSNKSFQVNKNVQPLTSSVSKTTNKVMSISSSLPETKTSYDIVDSMMSSKYPKYSNLQSRAPIKHSTNRKSKTTNIFKDIQNTQRAYTPASFINQQEVNKKRKELSKREVAIKPTDINVAEMRPDIFKPKKQDSENWFVREFKRGYKGEAPLKEDLSLKWKGFNPKNLGVVTAQTLGGVWDIASFHSGGGAGTQYKVVSKKLGVKDPGTLETIRRAGEMAGNIANIGSMVYGGGGAIKTLGGLSKNTKLGKAALNIGKGTKSIGKTTIKLGAKTPLVYTGLTEGSRSTMQHFSSDGGIKDYVKEKKQLENKYNLSVDEGAKSWIEGESSNFLSSQIPGIYGGIEKVVSKDKIQGDINVDKYLDEHNITNQQDRERIKDMIYKEVIAQQIGETGTQLYAISAGTEKLGQKKLAQLLKKESIITGEELTKKKAVSSISNKIAKETGKLGVAEGFLSEIVQDEARDEGVDIKKLAISGGLGGVTAGSVGKLVGRRGVGKAVDVKPDKLDTTTPMVETTAEIMDILEKPGDWTHKIVNKIKGDTEIPGIRKIEKIKKGKIEVEYHPTSWEPDNILGKIKVKTLTGSPTTSTSSVSMSDNMGNIGSISTPSDTNIPTYNQIGTLTETNTPSDITTPTDTETPSDITTPTDTETPSDTNQETPSDTETETETETTTNTNVPTNIAIPVVTPNNGAMMIPGLGRLFGWKSPGQVGELTYKINPIKNIKFSNLQKFLK